MSICRTDVYAWMRKWTYIHIHIYVCTFKVTGGGSGLGREICLELARRGCKVAVVDVNSKGCYETVELLSKIPRCMAKAYKVSKWHS